MSRRRTCETVACRCGTEFKQPKAAQRFCSQRCGYDARDDLKNPLPRFMSRVAKSEGCWLWSGKRNNKGYGMFSIRGRAVSAHRWFWQTLNGPAPESLYVLHSCDVPNCVNPAHLRLGTAKENTADAISRGRLKPIPHASSPHGSKHPFAKLNETDVALIRSSKLSARELTGTYGVHVNHIHGVRRGVGWHHV